MYGKIKHNCYGIWTYEDSRGSEFGGTIDLGRLSIEERLTLESLAPIPGSTIDVTDDLTANIPLYKPEPLHYLESISLPKFEPEPLHKDYQIIPNLRDILLL